MFFIADSVCLGAFMSMWMAPNGCECLYVNVKLQMSSNDIQIANFMLLFV